MKTCSDKDDKKFIYTHDSTAVVHWMVVCCAEIKFNRDNTQCVVVLTKFST